MQCGSSLINSLSFTRLTRRTFFNFTPKPPEEVQSKPLISSSTIHLIFNQHHNYRSSSSRPSNPNHVNDFRAFLEWMWPKSCCGAASRFTSCIISIYLITKAPVAMAHGVSSQTFTYPCEDVSSYYSSAEHVKGKALMKELNSIIAGHQSLSYKEVWDALKMLDAADVDKPESSSGVVEVYSLRVVPKQLAGKPEGWNREHLWPRSYGLSNGPSLTDLHNIRPADVNVNSSRGNKYFGECMATSAYCFKPANKEAASDTETDAKSWAPPLQVRGDIARALMYMAVRYGFHQTGGGPGLNLSDTPSTVRREMGLLSTLLKWNEFDPPSREEKLRNERICRLYQHDRNPFVDHPEYVNLIWGKLVSGSLSLHPHLRSGL